MCLLQAPTEAGVATLLSPPLHNSAVTPADSAKAQEEWLKADAYYYKSIARMQRLWEVLIYSTLNHAGTIACCRMLPPDCESEAGSFGYQHTAEGSSANACAPTCMTIAVGSLSQYPSSSKNSCVSLRSPWCCKMRDSCLSRNRSLMHEM